MQRIAFIILAMLIAPLSMAPLFGTAARAADLTVVEAKTLADAQAAFEQEKHDEAIQLLLPLRDKHPDLAEIPRLLTHAYFQAGQFEKARETALSAISRGRLSADILVRLAQIDQERNDQLALTNTVRLLTVLDAKNQEWRLIYGDLLATENSLAQSEAVFRELLKDQPESPELNLRLGNVLLRQEKLKEAATYLETAWHLGVESDKLPATIADVCRRLEAPEQAITWTERALAAMRDSVESTRLRMQLAQLCFTLKDLKRARQVALLVTRSEQAERRGQAHVLLGQVEMKEGRLDEAIKHWESALASGVDSQPLLAAVGAHHFNSGQFKKAADLLRRVVETSGPSEEHLRFLIISLIRSDDRDNARSFLRQYIEHYGLSDRAKQLVRLWAPT